MAGLVRGGAPRHRQRERAGGADTDADNWVYRLDSSNDGGRSWNEGAIEFTFRRSEVDASKRCRACRDPIRLKPDVTFMPGLYGPPLLYENPGIWRLW